MIKINYKNGSSLVEIVVAIFIFTVVLGLLINISSTYLSSSGDNLNIAKGAYLAEEGIEAVKIIRDSGWSNISSLSNNTNYYLYFNTSSSTNIWQATTSALIIDSIFARTFVLNPVYRDSNGRIINSGGTLDANTEQVVVSVSWPSKASTMTKSLSTYIANIL